MYTSKERDAETGLDFFGARYFSSAQGRFSSPDPLLSSGRPWDPQSWNRYTYGLNNPLRYTDPTGLYEWDATLGGNCTDKALNGGNCGTTSKAQGRDIVNERKAIRTELNRLANSSNAALRATASAIGGENKNNGVTVSTNANLPAGIAAQVSFDKPLTLDANGNPELNLQVRPGAQGDSLFIGLAHEGSHVWDAQAVARGDRPWMRSIETELGGYLMTVAAAQYLHSRAPSTWSSVGPSGGNPFWSSSWSNVDQQTRPPREIVNFLFNSPTYQKKLFDVQMTK